MKIADKLNKLTINNTNIIEKQKDKIYTFLVKSEDVQKIEALLETENLSLAQLIRKAISDTYKIEFEGNYKNVGRRGKN